MKTKMSLYGRHFYARLPARFFLPAVPRLSLSPSRYRAARASSSSMITALGFDADDTLWHNERIFSASHARLAALLKRYHDPAQIEPALNATERRNLPRYGYGIKSYALSAIETAIELSHGTLPAAEIRAIIALAHEMLDHPVEMLPAVPETIAQLAGTLPLIVITKGDLRDQHRKFTLSRLADHFAAFEVVTEKDPATYAAVLARHRLDPAGFLMVGNSIKSDILPVLAIGGHAAHVPYEIIWELDRTDEIPSGPRFHSLKTLAELPALLARLRDSP